MWQGRFGTEQESEGLLPVQSRFITKAREHVNDLVAATLDLDVLLGNPQLLLGQPNRGVGLRHLRGEQHKNVIVAGHGGQEGGIRGLDAASIPAPEVDLPRDTGAKTEIPEIPGRPAGFRWRDVGGGAGSGLRLGIPETGGDPQLCARLKDADGRDLQVVVGSMRLFDQTVQFRIAEDFPPGHQLGPGGGQSFSLFLIPVRCDRGLGRFEVGPDGGAGSQQQDDRHRDGRTRQPPACLGRHHRGGTFRISLVPSPRRWISAVTTASPTPVETPNMRIPPAASMAPSNRQSSLMTRSP